MGYYDAKTFYFGTRQSMREIAVPVQGADSSPTGWSSNGTLLNGGAYAVNSFGSHKQYTFEWRGTSSPEMAQLMKSYADGTYGRGLIHFIDPATYTKNILPARWADPSMAVNYEGSGLVYGVDPSGIPTSGGVENNLPVTSAQYVLDGVTPGYRGLSDSVFVPIPPGYSLLLGASYTRTGSGGVFYNTVDSSGTVSPTTNILAGTPPSYEYLMSAQIEGVPGVQLWVGRSDSTASSVTLAQMTARLWRTSDIGSPRAVEMFSAPWIGGMGNSGCRFNGKPTLVTNTAAYGGQMAFAASFIEVGDYAFG